MATLSPVRGIKSISYCFAMTLMAFLLNTSTKLSCLWFQTNLPVFRVKDSSVRRRYSDFEWLRNELERDSKVKIKLNIDRMTMIEWLTGAVLNLLDCRSTAAFKGLETPDAIPRWRGDFRGAIHRRSPKGIRNVC